CSPGLIMPSLRAWASTVDRRPSEAWARTRTACSRSRATTAALSRRASRQVENMWTPALRYRYKSAASRHSIARRPTRSQRTPGAACAAPRDARRARPEPALARRGAVLAPWAVGGIFALSRPLRVILPAGDRKGSRRRGHERPARAAQSAWRRAAARRAAAVDGNYCWAEEK